MKITLAAAVLALAAGAQAAGPMKSYKGKVGSIDGRKVHILVSDGSTGDWTVDPKAAIGSGRKHFSLSQVHPGDEVSVAVSEDGVIHRMSVQASGGDMWGKPSKNGKDRWWRGEIVRINEGAQEIQIKRVDGHGQGTTHFKADAKTHVYRAGHPPVKIGFGELKQGEIVEAVAAGGRTIEINVMPK
jgi:hypothetical protein